MSINLESKRFSSDRLQWCFSSLGCPELDLNGILDLARAFEIQAIELRAISGSLDLVDHLRRYKAQTPRQYQQLRDSGIIRMLDTSFPLACPQEEDYARLVELAGIADELNIPYCRVFGGFEYAPTPSASTIRDCARTMNEWRTRRQAHGLACELAVETHDGFSSAAHLARLYEACGERVPTVWDAHHTYRCGQESWDESLHLLAGAVVHIHVKDSHQTNGQVHTVLPGTGDIPIPSLLARLRDREWKTPVSLEWERLWEPDIPPLSEALAAARRSWI